MKKINLTRYGFIKSPENDFTDDGNRFTGYTMGRVTVSKLVKGDDVYISARINEGLLNYDEYSILPHYNNLDCLNDVSLAGLTDAALTTFASDCAAYESEYIEAEKNNPMPTRDDLFDYFTKERKQRLFELADVQSKLTVDFLFKLPDYTFRNVKDKFNNMKTAVSDSIECRVDRYLNTAASKTVIYQLIKESYSYTSLLEIINQYTTK